MIPRKIFDEISENRIGHAVNDISPGVVLKDDLGMVWMQNVIFHIKKTNYNANSC